MANTSPKFSHKCQNSFCKAVAVREQPHSYINAGRSSHCGQVLTVQDIHLDVIFIGLSTESTRITRWPPRACQNAKASFSATDTRYVDQAELLDYLQNKFGIDKHFGEEVILADCPDQYRLTVP